MDILCAVKAGAKGKVKLVPAKVVPAKFLDLVAKVGRELGMKEDWLNFGPAPLPRS